MKTPEQIAYDYADEIRWNRADEARVTEEEVRSLIERAIEADRAQRDRVWIVQSEDGDVLDVTDNEEWADWLTREDDDVPLRSKTEETVWSGPENREEWEVSA